MTPTTKLNGVCPFTQKKLEGHQIKGFLQGLPLKMVDHFLGTLPETNSK